MLITSYFIKLIVPSLNEQLDNDVLMLFRNGVICPVNISWMSRTLQRWWNTSKYASDGAAYYFGNNGDMLSIFGENMSFLLTN